MKKLFSLLLIVMCSFGFVATVNAEELWSSLQEDTTFLDSLITGNSSSIDTNKVNTFLGKYDLYYKYMSIEDTQTYQKYVNSVVNGESDSSADTLKALIGQVSSEQDLKSGWIQHTGATAFKFENLDYTTANGGKGYVLGIAVISKTEKTKIYVTRDIYEANSTTTLAKVIDMHQTQEVTPSTSTTETTTTSENPETGISDYAIYLVPLALVFGSVLMFRKNYA